MVVSRVIEVGSLRTMVIITYLPSGLNIQVCQSAFGHQRWDATRGVASTGFWVAEESCSQAGARLLPQHVQPTGCRKARLLVSLDSRGRRNVVLH